MSDRGHGIIESMSRYASRRPMRMHVPGHKGRKAFSKRESPDPTPEWASELLDELRAFDMTESPGLDNLHYPTGCIRDVERRAEKLFESARTHLLVNGATAGIQAALLAVRMTVGNGTVVLPRNVHRSMVTAMAMSGMEPVFVWPEYDPRLGGYLPLDAHSVKEALDVASSPNSCSDTDDGPPRAVLVLSPTYCGFSRDLKEVAEVVHSFGAVLIVDEAHGTHFSAGDSLPPSALLAGADLVVHGAHKTTVAYTQTALVHMGLSTPRLFPGLEGSLEEALRAVQTTSPSYILMASLEQAIALMERDGGAWVDRGVANALELTKRLSKIPNLSVVGREARVEVPAGLHHDPGRVLVNLNGLGCTGPQAAKYLSDKHKVDVEMTGPRNLLLIWTGADDQATIDAVEGAFVGLVQEFAAGRDLGPSTASDSAYEMLREAPRPRKVMQLRDAFLSVSEPVPIEEAFGRISADTIVIYPPGSPLITPGELIDDGIIHYIVTARKAGLNVLGRGITGNGNGASASLASMMVYCVKR